MGGYSSYDYSLDDDTVTKKSVDAYNIDVGRAYKEEEATGIPPPKGKRLTTNAKLPLVVAVDVTGSMREWPGVIFKKLCVLYNECLISLPDELKEDFEISFVAIGDAYCDKFPIQVTDFGKKEHLDFAIQSLYPEGGGGGQSMETYELVAYYYLKHCEMPNAMEEVKPLFVIAGDEAFYPKVNRSHIKNLIGDKKIKTDKDSYEVFKKLKQKFDVHILRIKYGDGVSEKKIHSLWQDILGPERARLMRDPARIVDCIIGLFSASVGRWEIFKDRIKVRQTPQQVEQVMESLEGIQNIYGDVHIYMGEKKDKALKCPECGAKIDKIPTKANPVTCQSCGMVIV